MVISILVRLDHRNNKIMVVILKSTAPFLMVSYYWRTGGEEEVQFFRIAHRLPPEVSGGASGGNKTGCLKKKSWVFIWF